MGSYTGELKRNLKSVRMTDTVYKYVQAFRGEGFNQKFENMVLYFMENEEKKKDAVEELDRQILEKSMELAKLETGKRLMDSALEALREFQEAFSDTKQ